MNFLLFVSIERKKAFTEKAAPLQSVIAAVIDPLLLGGGRTVSEIADLVLESLNGTLSSDGSNRTKSQIVNNVRQRMIQLQKQGFVLAKDSGKRLTFTRATEVRTGLVGEGSVRRSDKEIIR